MLLSEGDTMINGMNQRAFLYQIMKHKRERFMHGADGQLQMIETRIYVGLNDSETKVQEFETEKFMSVLKSVCKNYHVAFSVSIEEGGYYHEDGAYTEEKSFVLVLIDADRAVVEEIAKDLCTFFHQESVLVTENLLNGTFIYGEKFKKQLQEDIL